jgi:phage tail-like protein
MEAQPLTVSHFIVEWGGTRINFMEVSGLDIINEVTEIHEGGDKGETVRKLPGLRKYPNIVLKRGMIAGDNEFYNWMNTTNFNEIERRDVVIHLLNQDNTPVFSWQVYNAFPAKLLGPILNASENNVAIEILELAHEGLSVTVS